MKEIKVKSYEIIEEDGGIRGVEHEEIRSFTDEQVRDNDYCTCCGKDIYPECKKYCGIGKEIERLRAEGQDV